MGGNDMEVEECSVPVMTIQCDWEDTLCALNKEVWVSCKARGLPSTHSKLKNQGPVLPKAVDGEFTVLDLTKDSIRVKHNASGHVCVFVPPFKTFANIHKKSVTSMDVAEGGLGVSVCLENKLLIWNAVDGEVRRSLTGHLGDVYKVKLFPSGVVVLSAGADMHLRIWSAESGQCPVTLKGHHAAITDVAIVDKGRNIISVSKDGTAQIWDCGQSAKLGLLFSSTSRLNCCCIGIMNENLTSLSRVEPISEREINTQDKILYIGTEEGSVHAISVYNRKTIFTLSVDSPVNIILYLTKTMFMVGCQNGKILIYNCLDVQTLMKEMFESNSPVLSACLFGSQGFFVGRNDGTVTYYDIDNYSNLRISLTGSDCDPIYSICSTDDSVFTACRDGSIRKYFVANVIERN